MAKKQIGLKFEPELIEQIKEVAARENRPVNNLIETVMMDYVKSKSPERQGKKK